MPEYCNGFGVMFENDNFEQKLEEMYINYSKYKKVMSSYPFNSDVMSQDYLNLLILYWMIRNDWLISARAKT